MIVAMLAGCGGNSAEENAVQQQSEEAQEAGEIGFVPGEFPISKEPVTIKIKERGKWKRGRSYIPTR